MTRRFILLAVVATVLTATALPAVALPPEQHSFEFVDEFTDKATCDFAIEVRFVGREPSGCSSTRTATWTRSSSI